MSRRVRIRGWRPGLKKVALTLTVRRLAQLRLDGAKSVTDRVLDGEIVDVEVGDAVGARELARELQALGVVAEVLDNPG